MFKIYDEPESPNGWGVFKNVAVEFSAIPQFGTERSKQKETR